MDGVHADAVAEQRAAGLAAGGVDGQDRDLQRIALVEAEATHQLVGQRALARAAGTRNAENRGGLRCDVLRLKRAEFERGDRLRQRLGLLLRWIKIAAR